jgi:hypothetical protein
MDVQEISDLRGPHTAALRLASGMASRPARRTGPANILAHAGTGEHGNDLFRLLGSTCRAGHATFFGCEDQALKLLAAATTLELKYRHRGPR